MADGHTDPPPLLTESYLIELMDKNGIGNLIYLMMLSLTVRLVDRSNLLSFTLGTDATHAEHIETIKARKYVAVQNGRFVPGELGIGLVEGKNSSKEFHGNVLLLLISVIL